MTRIRSLGQKDALEEEMASHPSMLAWEIPGPEEPGGLQVARVRHDLATKQRRPTEARVQEEQFGGP